MSHIYSKEHQRLLKMPIMQPPSIGQFFNGFKTDNEVITSYEYAEAEYNNWLSPQPLIPEEHRECFSKYRDGEELKEGVDFRIEKRPFQEKIKDEWASGILLVALPIIKEDYPIDEIDEIEKQLAQSIKLYNEQRPTKKYKLVEITEQNKDNNVISGNKSIEHPCDAPLKDGATMEQLWRDAIRANDLSREISDAFRRGHNLSGRKIDSSQLYSFLHKFFDNIVSLLNKEQSVQVSDTTEAK